ncbi:hypothetical protein IF2G_02608 [Cordyceps javanica]|nr:hypothetical protein IF2G_02608 [Cordyceps javanica]
MLVVWPMVQRIAAHLFGYHAQGRTETLCTLLNMPTSTSSCLVIPGQAHRRWYHEHEQVLTNFAFATASRDPDCMSSGLAHSSYIILPRYALQLRIS